MAEPGRGDPEARAEGGDSVSVAIAVDGQDKLRKFRLAPGKRRIKVGRSPKCDIVLDLPGLSLHHLDILARPGQDDQAGPCVSVQDRSKNGTGVLEPSAAWPRMLPKGAAIDVATDSMLIVPCYVNSKSETPEEDLRVGLKVTFGDAAGKRSREGDDGAREDASAAKKQKSLQEQMMERCRDFASMMQKKREAEAFVAAVPPFQPPPPAHPPPPQHPHPQLLPAMGFPAYGVQPVPVMLPDGRMIAMHQTVLAQPWAAAARAPGR